MFAALIGQALPYLVFAALFGFSITGCLLFEVWR